MYIHVVDDSTQNRASDDQFQDGTVTNHGRDIFPWQLCLRDSNGISVVSAAILLDHSFCIMDIQKAVERSPKSDVRSK